MVLASQATPLAAALSALQDARARVGPALRDRIGDDGIRSLVAYHLGFTDHDGRPCDGPDGKLVRPALCLIVAEGYGRAGDALDAAVAVELVHAFSLVHDDIEDGDSERRHRPTLWARVGVPLALNCGDYLFALAQEALLNASSALGHERAIHALHVLNGACMRMIEGQHADLEFESLTAITRDQYIEMARGKTGALIGAALALGAICGHAPVEDVAMLQEAGAEMGLAFQAIDDALSVWGDPDVTGKPAGGDVARGKKCLPVVIAAELDLAVTDPHVEAAVRAEASLHASRAEDLIRRTSLPAPAVERLASMMAFVVERKR